MKCGVCGGGIRGYRGTLHGRPIQDWKHTDVPPDTQPHRPVLGTPVDEETLERHRTLKKESRVAKPPVAAPALPRVRPRLAKVSEVPARAQTLAELAVGYGWHVEPPTYVQTAAGIEWVVVRAARAGVAAVGVWERRPATEKTPSAWSYSEGYRVAPGAFGQVGSEQLKSWLSTRDERCPDCGKASMIHTDEGTCPS